MQDTKEKYYEILDVVFRLLEKGTKLKDLDKNLQEKLSLEDYEYYLQHKEEILFEIVHIVNESLNEKFVKDSDPIKDMGIGREHWLDKILEIFANDFFDSVDEAEVYMEIAEDELEKMYQQGISEKEAAYKCYQNYPEFWAELEKRINNQTSPEDDLKANCRSWQDGGTKEDANELANYLFQRHPGYSEDELRQMAYDWVGIEDESNLDEGCGCGSTKRPRPVTKPGTRRPIFRPGPRPGAPKLHEKFEEDSDPIHDLGIGTVFYWTTIRDIVGKQTSNEFESKYNIEYPEEMNLDVAFLIYRVLGRAIKIENIQIAFDDECKNLNFDKREFTANVLKKHFNIKVDPGKKTVFEKFTASGDPIKDMNIGMTPKKIAEKFINDMYGNIDKISQTYFGDKKHVGNAYVLYNFFRKIYYTNVDVQRAFEYACNSENYYGNRPDIIEDRKNLAHVIEKYFGINVNSLYESKKIKINESMKNYDIPTISKIAILNLGKWIARQDYMYFQNELDNLQSKNAPDTLITKLLYDFFDTHIENFFNIFSKHSGIEPDFLEDHRDQIINKMIFIAKTVHPRELAKEAEKLQLSNEEENEIETLIKKSQAEKSKPVEYSKMSQYDLKKEVDAALDNKDYEKLKKLQPYIKEGFLKYHVIEVLNEEYLIEPLL